METMALNLRGPRLVRSDYHSRDMPDPTYDCMLRDEEDVPVGFTDAVRRACELGEVADGDEFVLIAIRTGRRPFGERKIRNVGGGQYRREEHAAK